MWETWWPGVWLGAGGVKRWTVYFWSEPFFPVLSHGVGCWFPDTLCIRITQGLPPRVRNWAGLAWDPRMYISHMFQTFWEPLCRSGPFYGHLSKEFEKLCILFTYLNWCLKFFFINLISKELNFPLLKILMFYFKIFFLFLFLAAPHSLRDLSSPTRIEPEPSAVKVRSPNHWTTREFPILMF